MILIPSLMYYSKLTYETVFFMNNKHDGVSWNLPRTGNQLQKKQKFLNSVSELTSNKHGLIDNIMSVDNMFMIRLVCIFYLSCLLQQTDCCQNCKLF